MTNKTEKTPEVATKPRAGELVNSLTGFEEIAIEQLFRKSFMEMGESSTSLRALAFIVEKRDGMGDTDAFRKVMELPFSEVVGYLDTSGGEDQGEA